MELISDILLLSGSIAAAAYCFALRRRLARLSQLDGGIGGAIAVLSLQVDDLTRALAQAKASSDAATTNLATLTQKADATATRLELTLSALHDLPNTAAELTQSPLQRRPRYTRSRRTENEIAA